MPQIPQNLKKRQVDTIEFNQVQKDNEALIRSGANADALPQTEQKTEQKRRKGGNDSPLLVVRVHPDTLALLKSTARVRRKRMSELVRSLLDKGMEQEGLIYER